MLKKFIKFFRDKNIIVACSRKLWYQLLEGLKIVEVAGGQFYFISFSLPVFAPIWHNRSQRYRR